MFVMFLLLGSIKCLNKKKKANQCNFEIYTLNSTIEPQRT